VDAEAKKVAQGLSSDAKLLPPFLCKHLPASISALHQSYKKSILKTWKRRWKDSPCYKLHHSIDNSAPSKKYLSLLQGLDWCQASLLMQLCTGHTSLNHHLFRIRKVESPVCIHCRGITVETVKHLLIDCPFYRRERHVLQRKIKRNAASISFLLSNPTALKPLLTFIHSTGRFKDHFGSDDKLMTNARRKAELLAGARALGSIG
jgi:hypothetical protein